MSDENNTERPCTLLKYLELGEAAQIDYVNQFLLPSVVRDIYGEEWGDSPNPFFLGRVVKVMPHDRHDPSKGFYCFVRPLDPMGGEEIRFFSDREEESNVYLKCGVKLEKNTFVLVEFDYSSPEEIERAREKIKADPEADVKNVPVVSIISNPQFKVLEESRIWELLEAYEKTREILAFEELLERRREENLSAEEELEEKRKEIEEGRAALEAALEGKRKEIEEGKAALEAELEEKRKEIEEEKAALKEKLSGLEAEARERLAGIGELKKEAEELKEEAKRHREEMKTLGRERRRLQREREKFEELGIVFPDPEKEPEAEEEAPEWNYAALIKKAEALEETSELKGMLRHYRFHGRRILDRFLCATLTGQLIILSGPSGTGKTTLPKVVSDLAGGKCRVIAVQPDWTDEQDLFGFYHFVEQRYISTAFLDALMEAKKDPGHVHFIVLDEMNLAHVEYYFAGFLSGMELEGGRGGEITLYSDFADREENRGFMERLRKLCQGNEKLKEAFRIAGMEENDGKDLPEIRLESGETVRDLLDRFLAESEEYREWHSDYEAFRKKRCLFPPRIRIPANVQIVGTINMDETTKGISPKVLDRSIVIEIGEEKSEEADAEETGYFLEEELSEGEADGVSREITERIEAFRDQVNEGDTPFRLSFSARAKERLGRMVSHCLGEGGKKPDIEAFADDFVLGKLLPLGRSTERIISPEKHQALVRRLAPEGEGMEESLKKLSGMYREDMQTYDYWE